MSYAFYLCEFYLHLHKRIMPLTTWYKHRHCFLLHLKMVASEKGKWSLLVKEKKLENDFSMKRIIKIEKLICTLYHFIIVSYHQNTGKLIFMWYYSFPLFPSITQEKWTRLNLYDETILVLKLFYKISRV